MAGAWTQQQGHGLVIISVDHSRASLGFDDDGQSEPIEGFQKTELRAYLEYGLTNRVTLVAQPEWRQKEIGEGPGDKVNGLGRVDAGARLRLWQNDASVVSVQATARMPGARDTIAPANGGDTDWEGDVRGLYGRGFTLAGRHAFVDMQLGYRVRLGNAADEVRFDLTTGIDITPKVLALLQSFNTLSVGDVDAPFLLANEHKASASIVYRFDENWSFQLGGLITIAGRNALQERGGSVAIWRSF